MIPNLEQRAAINSDAETTVVAAGPGSGKTKTLELRVRSRVASGVNPKRIVVLTFTNAGAWAFTQRLQPLVLGFAGTLHGYCMRLLQAFGGEIGYRAGSISIVTKETQEALLLATAKRLGVKLSLKALLAHGPVGNPLFQGSEALVWNEYRHELKRSNMIDYDLILVDALKMLEMSPRVTDNLRVEELYVDECQDSGAIDWKIYDAIEARREFFIGDGDQSVYSFRGAHPEIFVNAAIRHAALTLSKNYRSDIAICEAATKLIRHNSNRIDKPVVAVSKEPGSVTVAEVENDTAEIFETYKRIRESGYGVNGCAILCRTNAIANRFRTMLNGFGVAVKRTGEMRLPEDWSRTLSAIALMIDPLNNHHAEQVILMSKPTAPTNMEKMKLDAIRAGKPLSDGFLNVDHVKTLDDGLNYLYRWLSVSDDSMELIRQRVAVLPNEKPTLSDLLSDLWSHDKWNVDDEGDGITVCTIHGAKGKEWDFVLVPAMEEGILPSKQAITANAAERYLNHKLGEGIELTDCPSIEEERRLFFVAITRARHALVLMHAKQRTTFGKTTTQEPSRFLAEIR